MKTMRFLLAGSLVVTIAACEQDILDTQPLDAFLDEDVWSDLTLTEMFVNQTYRGLIGFFNTGDNGLHTGAWDYSGVSDEAYATHNWISAWRIYDGTLAPDNPATNPWDGMYRMIRNANLILQRIDEVPGDDGIRTRLTGETKLLRAWYYAWLIKHYSGVPLITEPFGLNDDFNVPRATFDEVVQWIVGEIGEAIELLPVQQSGDELGRMDQGAARAMKADILLFAASELHNPEGDLSKWQAASDAAKDVIDMGLYSLWDGAEYQDLFLSLWNEEIIFGRLNAGEFEAHNPELTQAPNGYNGWSAHTPTQQLVDAFEMANGRMITDPASGYDPNNPYEGRDPRFTATIVYDGLSFFGREAEFWDGGRDSNKGIQPWNVSLTGYTFRKFFDETRDFSAGDLGIPDRLWPLFRLAEMYLNYAEAQYQLGNEAAAREYVNLVRARPSVNLPPITENGTALLERIRHERQIELVFEAKRFFDILRWKTAEVVMSEPVMGVVIQRDPETGAKTYEYREVRPRTFHPHMYLMPIPQSEVERSDYSAESRVSRRVTRSVRLNAAARLLIAPPRPRPRILVAVVLAVGGCTSSDTEVSSGPRFTLLDPSATGVTFANVVPENPVMNGFTYEYYYNGGGVAAGDLDGDGLADLFFTSNIQGNRLYLNRGDMRFEDVTTPAGVRGRRGGWATGVSFADVNADGRLDIYVSYSGPFDDPDRRRNVLYINKGVQIGRAHV